MKLKKDLSNLYKYNKKTFVVRYHGATNTKGSRISVTDSITKKRKYFSYCYETGSVLQQGVKIVAADKYELVGFSELPDSYIIVVEWKN